MSGMWNFIKPSTRNLRVWQVGLLVLIFVFWHLATTPGLIPPIVFENDQQAELPGAQVARAGLDELPHASQAASCC